jgi:hypothetical protein
MARRNHEEDEVYYPPPATTLEGREEQLIAAAMDLAEERIRTKTASAQEVVHFLRQGTVAAQLQNDKLKSENEVLLSRVREMEGRKSQEDLLTRALAAFRGYSGQDPIEGDEDFYEDQELY